MCVREIDRVLVVLGSDSSFFERVSVVLCFESPSAPFDTTPQTVLALEGV